MKGVVGRTMGGCRGWGNRVERVKRRVLNENLYRQLRQSP